MKILFVLEIRPVSLSSCSSTLHTQIGTDTLSLPGDNGHSLPGAFRVVSQLSQEDEQLLEAAQVLIGLFYLRDMAIVETSFCFNKKSTITETIYILINLVCNILHVTYPCLSISLYKRTMITGNYLALCD